MAFAVSLRSDPRDLELKRRQAEALEAIAKTLAEIEKALRPTVSVPTSIEWNVGVPTSEE